MTASTGSADAPHAPAFLALGDSYTIGEGVDPSGRWPVQLAGALRDEGFDLGEPHVIATTGWTTDELDAGIDAAHAQAPLGTDHALVSLLIGVNNQYRGRPLDEFRVQFAALLARAIGFAGSDPRRVLVLAIPDWGVTPFAIAQSRDAGLVATQIDAFNATCREESLRAGAHWIDIAPASREHGGEVRMLADDGLHPSAAMYALWSALALPAARTALAHGTLAR
ncbi:SGNH/GDSL hydrolase family protein [Pseudoxanthomonas daejeonensis]|uniref:Lysophospholipase n=1 Tax=Pseudoxanthomonas daejeonensis TaxID=266062 RepID=A0ABQ6Z7P7_9GAMM|nr:SGNH/GDSL hydrolase family protein [Pseudoxanthomonas daejeonensis]KAF1695069.1 lysophospholipase [Pseudoxanthomonas daejeonensis]UNK56155.1 SGNH/GDSL hydrolase family protein [Pseudoxanthomonas daejeonensis]